MLKSKFGMVNKYDKWSNMDYDNPCKIRSSENLVNEVVPSDGKEKKVVFML